MEKNSSVTCLFQPVTLRLAVVCSTTGIQTVDGMVQHRQYVGWAKHVHVCSSIERMGGGWWRVKWGGTDGGRVKRLGKGGGSPLLVFRFPSARMRNGANETEVSR